MAKRKISTLTIALGIASVLALIIGLAFSAGGGGILAKAQAGEGLSERNRHHECSEATLEGEYLVTFRVDSRSDLPDPMFPVVGAGVRTFDGEGNLHDLFTISGGGVITRRVEGTGTYTLDSDCTGTMTIAGVRHWDIYVARDGSEAVAVGTDEGSIRAQTLKKR